MARTSKEAPRDQGESLSNEQRINILLQQGQDNDTIMFGLCRMRVNLAAETDDNQRKKLADKYHIECPKFNRIFRQRLLEQIRKCKCRYKKDGDELDFFDTLRDDDGSARDVGEIAIEEIHRFSVGFSSIDEILGKDPINGEIGMPNGCCLIFGAPKGVGKTRLTVQIAAFVGHPFVEKDQNGNSGVLYIQNEEKLSVFRSRAAKVWSPEHKIKLSSSDNLIQHVALVHKHRPKLIVVDSIQDTRQARFCTGIRHMLMTYKAVAEDLGCSFWLISHLNGKGDLMGGTYAGYKVDIELIANRMANPSEFVVKSGKNRYGSIEKNAQFIHKEEGILEIPPPSEEVVLSFPPLSLSKEGLSCG